MTPVKQQSKGIIEVVKSAQNMCPLASNSEGRNKPAYKNAGRATYLIDPITGEKYYQCPLCPKRLKGHLTIHLRTHNGRKPWKCSHCNKRFSQKCNLQTHIKSVHEAGQRFKCELCSKSFDYKKNLERHITCHLKEKPYKCPYCPRRFTAVDWLCKHKREHTLEKPYDCIFCPQLRFAQYHTAIAHLKWHIRERPYFCKFCDNSYVTSSSLWSHVRIVHCVNPMTCLFCEKVFQNKYNLFSHLRHVHIAEGHQSYRCARFSSAAKQEKVKKVKKVEKNSTRYICQELKCNKVYRKRIGLTRHWLNNHIPMNERPFSCELCNKSFAEHSFLRDHLLTHTHERPEQCPVCLTRFRWKATLNRHLKVVHNKRTVTVAAGGLLEGCQCKVCLKKYASTSQLQTHFEKEHMGNEVVRLERIVVPF